MNYWLFKSEPDEYGIEDLRRAPRRTGRWDGIRNYQARNLLRDAVKKGDLVFIYHSSCKQVGIAGIAEVVKAAYPDPAQFDRTSQYVDAGSDPANPRWYCVDVKFRQQFDNVIPLAALKAHPALQQMVLLKQGRLSVQPVSKREWQTILHMA